MVDRIIEGRYMERIKQKTQYLYYNSSILLLLTLDQELIQVLTVLNGNHTDKVCRF